MTQDTLYWLWLSCVDGVTRSYMNKLLKEYKSPQEIFRAPGRELAALLPERILEIWEEKKDLRQTEMLWKSLQKDGITFVHRGHPAYPEQFADIPDPPLCLFIKGRLCAKKQKSVAVIGSRNASPYGLACAEYFAGALAGQGIHVISGLAMGIDGAAHRAALKQHGYTVGFIAGGIYSMYPRQNYDLYQSMQQSGAIVSEYPPAQRPLGRLFPERNRLISGYSDAVLVVEAAKKSGTLITVDQGLEQGKTIYAVPGRITDENSQGCMDLIRDGATVVTGVQDILEDMHWTDAGCAAAKGDAVSEEESLTGPEMAVYQLLEMDPVYVDALVAKTGMPVSKVLSIVLSLELKGYISQPVKNYYMKRLGTCTVRKNGV